MFFTFFKCQNVITLVDMATCNNVRCVRLDLWCAEVVIGTKNEVHFGMRSENQF